MQNKISTFVITKNEEANIEKCLQSLSWADEIVVIDANSSDKTLELAKKYTDKIFVRPWSGFSDQRNFALSKCVYDWVFFLDADETCSPELISFFEKFKRVGIEGLKEVINHCDAPHPKGRASKPDVSLIEVKRLEHFRGKVYFYGEKTPSYQWRLFRRHDACFIGEVHEYVTFEGTIRRIELPILHYPPETISNIMDKINYYSTLDAQGLYKKGVKHSVLYMFFSGLSIFLKSYFRKGGYKDGVFGFILATLIGTTFFLRQAKLYLKHRNLE